ncbi:hypothetical protein BC829DRAFT_417187 [Chytridium lagenaria]|nr:hypothetical protein BC829DRAFT_417187 [Chytridium lagenaria]
MDDQDSQIHKLRQELSEATAALNDYARQVKDEREKAINAEERCTKLEKKLEEVEKDSAGAEEYIAGLERQLARREDLAAQVEILEADLEEARSEEARRESILADLERRLAESVDSVETVARLRAIPETDENGETSSSEDVKTGFKALVDGKQREQFWRSCWEGSWDAFGVPVARCRPAGEGCDGEMRKKLDKQEAANEKLRMKLKSLRNRIKGMDVSGMPMIDDTASEVSSVWLYPSLREPLDLTRDPSQAASLNGDGTKQTELEASVKNRSCSKTESSVSSSNFPGSTEAVAVLPTWRCRQKMILARLMKSLINNQPLSRSLKKLSKSLGSRNVVEAEVQTEDEKLWKLLDPELYGFERRDSTLVESKTEIQTQTEIFEAKAEIETQTEAPESKTEIQTQTEYVESKAEIETQTEIAVAKAEVQSQTETELAELKTEIQTQTEALESKAEIQTQTEVLESKAEIQTQTEASEAKSAIQTQTEASEPKFATREQTESKAEIQTKLKLWSQRTRLRPKQRLLSLRSRFKPNGSSESKADTPDSNRICRAQGCNSD